MINDIKIYKGVRIEKEFTVESFSIIGVPPRGEKDGDVETLINENAHIRSHSVIYAGNNIGKNFQTGNKVNIREFNTIGNNVSIGTLSVIEHHVNIGDNVRIHSQVFIPEYSVIEDGAWIGPNVVFTNAKYPQSPDAKKNLVGPTIRKGAIIGANSTLLPGVTIGENAIIGAGTVVVSDVDENTVVVGNPGVKVNTVNNLPY